MSYSNLEFNKNLNKNIISIIVFVIAQRYIVEVRELDFAKMSRLIF